MISRRPHEDEGDDRDGDVMYGVGVGGRCKEVVRLEGREESECRDTIQRGNASTRAASSFPSSR